jgi:hypothetical protein
MPLTWDTAEIENYEEVCFMHAEADMPAHGIEAGDRMLNPVTNALIWASLGTGIGKIKDTNAAEVYARIRLIEALHGPLLYRPGSKDGITLDDVRKHIGLTTNAAFTDKSRTDFLRQQAASFLSDTQAAAQREIDRKVELSIVDGSAAA